ncbi:MAG TPA: imidazolonepropionase [Candidatus Sulfotelmatobacter sp.]|jgi:imidazolonepropionase|nr:imidazolonepropionase [Candidatus Sulfotelmatobacter sp.]
MIEADLAVVGISQLATPEGRHPRLGADLGRVRVVDDAAVACAGDRIVFVGSEREFRRAVAVRPGGRTLDARGGTVIPGFVDAHTHLPFAGWRESEFNERLAGKSYAEIAARGGGILSTVSATRAASRVDLASLVRARLDAMLSLGTTLVEAKSGYGLEREAELKQLTALRDGARGHPVEVVATFLGAHTVPLERRGDRARYVEEVARGMLPEVARAGLASYADVFVDAHAFSLAEARLVLEAAAAEGLGVRLHADQLADDSAAALAAALGAASADHLEHVSDEGIEALARAGTVAVLLPAATFFLMQEKRPPARRLVDAGVAVAVATDFNPGTCPTEAMGTVLEHACLSLRLTIDEAIAAATLNAAHALGRAGETGSIEVGKRADLVVHAVPNRYHLVYRLGVRRVRTVIASGRVVVDEGELIRI